MNEEITIKNIARSIYINQRDGRARCWDLTNYDGCMEMAEEIFNLIKTGHILKYSSESIKNIDIDSIDNVKSSWGLYLSYTLAKMKSAGMLPNTNSDFISNQLKWGYLQSKTEKSPHYLFNSLVDHCKKISQLYTKMYIKDNIENQKVYQPLLDDLILGMTKLGLFNVEKV